LRSSLFVDPPSQKQRQQSIETGAEEAQGNIVGDGYDDWKNEQLTEWKWTTGLR
jgi:hypothetical protein